MSLRYMLKERTRHFLVRLHRILILLFVILIPWQIYLRVYRRIDLPLAFFVACAGIAIIAYMGGDVKRVYLNMKWPVLGYVLMLAAISISSVMHGPHGLYDAANILGRLGIGLLILLWVGLTGSMNNDIFLRKELLIRVFLLSVFPLAIIGLMFYFAPELEIGWLRAASGILIEADSSLTRGNVLSAYKTGVVFMNANVAGIFWGTAMWLALWMQHQSRGAIRLVYIIVAVIFCLDVLATASRSAMMALAGTALLSIILQAACSPKKGWLNHKTALHTIIIVVTVLSASALEKLNVFRGGITHRIMHENAEPAGSHPLRGQLWAHAFTVIQEAPLLGHGVVDFASLNFPMGFPPHNSVLQVWIYGGVIAVMGFFCLFFALLFDLFRRLRHDNSLWLPIIILTWAVIQAMFTNLPIVEPRIAMSLWLMVSLFLWSPQPSAIRQRIN